ncbi:MAG: site-2 protease family protein [Betaproteobacteria bacterium]|nr:MAG: site-2 protease family protein [Betaproteobacteria bacterium]
MDVSQLAQTLAIYSLPVLFAITLHEAAHGYVARHFGDLTAYAQGRISLNPVRHIDLVGTIIVPILILVVSKLAGGAGYLFGWAKPVPVNYSALRRPKQNMMWVAAAGPVSNLAMALAWAAIIKVADVVPADYFATPMRRMGIAGIEVNMVLMLLNLLPILPLDGGRIVASLLPHRMAWQYAKLEPFGFPILLVLLFTGYLGVILGPMLSVSFALIGTVFRL